MMRVLLWVMVVAGAAPVGIPIDMPNQPNRSNTGYVTASSVTADWTPTGYEDSNHTSSMVSWSQDTGRTWVTVGVVAWPGRTCVVTGLAGWWVVRRSLGGVLPQWEYSVMGYAGATAVARVRGGAHGVWRGIPMEWVMGRHDRR